jgi:uncharacterized membrane protein YphA (DoxX/SURF4 family)
MTSGFFTRPSCRGTVFGAWRMKQWADFCMLLGSLYLLIEGGGRWSLDALLSKTPQRRA